MILNGIEIKSRKSLYHILNKNDIDFFIDDDNEINSWFNLNSINNNIKKFFLEKIKNIRNERRLSVVLFFNSNEFTLESFPDVRFQSYMNFIDESPKDKVSKKYFQLRYGSETHLEKYKNNKDKQKLTLSNFIKKYGETEGNKKWDSYIQKQKLTTKRSIEYWMKECDGDEKIAKQKLNEYQTSHREKFKEGKTEEEIKKHDLENSPWCIEYWIKRDFTEKESKDKISQMKKESSMFCKDRYIKEGYTEEDAIKMAKEYWVKNCTDNNQYTSKESLKLFNTFIEKLEKLNICVYYGDSENGKNEYFLNNGNTYYFYDLTILDGDNKLIIEYHGETFHPNKVVMSVNEWSEWKQLFTGKSADEVHKKDTEKKNLAIKNGFKYLEIWSNDENKEEKIKHFIETNL